MPQGLGTMDPPVPPPQASPKDLGAGQSLLEGDGQSGFRGWKSFSGSLLGIVGFGSYSKNWLWSIKKFHL